MAQNELDIPVLTIEDILGKKKLTVIRNEQEQDAEPDTPTTRQKRQARSALDDTCTSLREAWTKSKWGTKPPSQGLSNSIYCAVLRAVLLAWEAPMETLGERLRHCDLLAQAMNIQSEVQDQAVTQSLTLNNTVARQLNERITKLKEGKTMPTRSDFVDEEGFMAWQEAEEAELQRLIEVQRSLPTFNGLLDIEVVKAEDLKLHKSLRARIRSCGWVMPYPINPYTLVWLSKDPAAPKQQQSTEVLQDTNEPAWNKKIPPLLLSTPQAELNVQINHHRVVNETAKRLGMAARDRLVGKNGVMLRGLTPGATYSIDLNVYGHRPRGTCGSGTWWSGYDDDLDDDEEEEKQDPGAAEPTGGVVYDPVNNTVLGLQGRPKNGRLTLKVRYIVENRMAADSALDDDTRRLIEMPELGHHGQSGGPQGAGTAPAKTAGKWQKAAQGALVATSLPTSPSSNQDKLMPLPNSGLSKNSLTNVRGKDGAVPGGRKDSGTGMGRASLLSLNIFANMKKVNIKEVTKESAAEFAKPINMPSFDKRRSLNDTFRQLAATLFELDKQRRLPEVNQQELFPAGKDLGPLKAIILDPRIAEFVRIGLAWEVLLQFAKLYRVREQVQRLLLMHEMIIGFKTSFTYLELLKEVWKPLFYDYVGGMLTGDEITGLQGVMGCFLEKAIPVLNNHYTAFSDEEAKDCLFTMIEIMGWAFSWNPDKEASMEPMLEHLEEAALRRLDTLRHLDIDRDLTCAIMKVTEAVTGVAQDLRRDLLVQQCFPACGSLAMRMMRKRYRKLVTHIEAVLAAQPGQSSGAMAAVHALEEGLADLHLQLCCNEMGAWHHEMEGGRSSADGRIELYNMEPLLMVALQQWITGMVGELEGSVDRLLAEEQWNPVSNNFRVVPSVVELYRMLQSALEVWTEMALKGSVQRKTTLGRVIMTGVATVVKRYLEGVKAAWAKDMADQVGDAKPVGRYRHHPSMSEKTGAVPPVNALTRLLRGHNSMDTRDKEKLGGTAGAFAATMSNGLTGLDLSRNKNLVLTRRLAIMRNTLYKVMEEQRTLENALMDVLQGKFRRWASTLVASKRHLDGEDLADTGKRSNLSNIEEDEELDEPVTTSNFRNRASSNSFYAPGVVVGNSIALEANTMLLETVNKVQLLICNTYSSTLQTQVAKMITAALAAVNQASNRANMLAMPATIPAQGHGALQQSGSIINARLNATFDKVNTVIVRDSIKEPANGDKAGVSPHKDRALENLDRILKEQEDEVMEAITAELEVMGDLLDEVRPSMLELSLRGVVRAAQALALNQGGGKPLGEEGGDFVRNVLKRVDELYMVTVEEAALSCDTQAWRDSLSEVYALLQALQANPEDLMTMYEVQVKCFSTAQSVVLPTDSDIARMSNTSLADMSSVSTVGALSTLLAHRPPVSSPAVMTRSPQQLRLLDLLRMLRQRRAYGKTVRQFIKEQQQLMSVNPLPVLLDTLGTGNNDKLLIYAKCTLMPNTSSLGTMYFSNTTMIFTTLLDCDSKSDTDTTVVVPFDTINAIKREGTQLMFDTEERRYHFTEFEGQLGVDNVLMALKRYFKNNSPPMGSPMASFASMLEVVVLESEKVLSGSEDTAAVVPCVLHHPLLNKQGKLYVKADHMDFVQANGESRIIKFTDIAKVSQQKGFFTTWILVSLLSSDEVLKFGGMDDLLAAGLKHKLSEIMFM